MLNRSLAFLIPLALATSAAAQVMPAAKAYAANNMPEARRLAGIAAARGEINAQTMMGYMLSQGIGGPKDDNAAARWYGAAARAGEADAYFGLGMMAADGRGGLKPEHAAGYLKLAADRKHAEAARRLAELYYLGKGVAKDPKQMMYWLERSANLNDAQAAYAAGTLFADGDAGAPKDLAKARKYLAQGANAGLPNAMADYGLFLYQGRTGTPDKPAAAQWFAKAAAKGDPSGQFLYAYVLTKGDGVTRNLEEAYKWLVRSEASNDPQDAQDRARLRTILEAAIPADKRATLEAAARGGVPALAPAASTR